jgi:hypothetical protein
MYPVLTKKALLLCIICSSCCPGAIAQQPDTGSAIISAKLADKLAAQVADKTDKYYRRITDKTEKTLEKLAKFENRIKTLLQKGSPETAARLFDNQPTFTDVLAKYREGKAIALQYGKRYDEYRDKLAGTMGYLASNGKTLPQPSSPQYFGASREGVVENGTKKVLDARA